MQEQTLDIATRDGAMETFVCYPERGGPYPAVFLLTGANDGRVDPANSRKMTARLQAATSSGRPVLLQVSFESGHGIGDNLSDQIDRSADVYAFLFGQLGVHAPASP